MNAIVITITPLVIETIVMILHFWFAINLWGCGRHPTM